MLALMMQDEALGWIEATKVAGRLRFDSIETHSHTEVSPARLRDPNRAASAVRFAHRRVAHLLSDLLQKLGNPIQTASCNLLSKLGVGVERAR